MRSHEKSLGYIKYTCPNLEQEVGDVQAALCIDLTHAVEGQMSILIENIKREVTLPFRKALEQAIEELEEAKDEIYHLNRRIAELEEVKAYETD